MAAVMDRQIKMAALMDLVNLTGLQNPTDILGIQEAHDDNSILVIYISVYIFIFTRYLA